MATAADERSKSVSKRTDERSSKRLLLILDRAYFAITCLATTAPSGIHFGRADTPVVQGTPGALFEGHNAKAVYVQFQHSL